MPSERKKTPNVLDDLLGGAAAPPLPPSRPVAPPAPGPREEPASANLPDEQAVILENQKARKLTKVAYRFGDDAIAAVEDCKRILRRHYGIKANLEEIVELAVLEAFADLERQGDASFLVKKLSGRLEI